MVNPLEALSDVDCKIKALLSTVPIKSELLGEKKEKEKEKDKKGNLDLSLSSIQPQPEGKSTLRSKRSENVRSKLVYNKESSSKNKDETPLRKLY